MVTQSFTAMFNIEGNASQQLQRIRSNAQALQQSALRLSTPIRDVAHDLQNLSKASSQQFGAGAEGLFSQERLKSIANSLEAMGLQGRFSASQLQQMSREMTFVAERSTPLVARELRTLSSRLSQTSADLQLAEKRFRGTGLGMEFMGDVSQNTAMRFRMMSSAAQGMLLGMSALEGQVTNLAFSLIFLQFAGQLQLAIATAGVTAAFTLAIRKFQEWRKEAGRIRELSNLLFIITRNTQAYSLATARADDIVKSLGLTGSNAAEVTKALTEAQVALRDKGIEPTEDNLSAFTALLLKARAAGEDWEESLQTALDGMLEFAESGKVGTTSLEELRKQGGAALSILLGEAGQFTATAGEIREAFEKLGVAIPPGLAQVAHAAEDTTFRVFDVMAGLPPRQAQALRETLLETKRSTEEISNDFISAFEGIGLSAESQFGPGGRAQQAVLQFIEDLNNAVGAAQRVQQAVDSISGRQTPRNRPRSDPGTHGAGGAEGVIPSVGDIPIETDLNLGGPELMGRSPVQVNNSVTIQNPNFTDEEQASEVSKDIIEAMQRGTDIGFINIT